MAVILRLDSHEKTSLSCRAIHGTALFKNIDLTSQRTLDQESELVATPPIIFIRDC